MRAIDLCAGAGGLALGLQRAGWDVVGVEHDADAVDTHRAMVGPCRHADIRDWHPDRPAVLVAGGVPCQSFSQAGQRAGTADPRGQLYLQLLRIAEEAQAQVVLLENVRGLIYRGLDEIRAAFEARGWLTRWALLDAADYGVPQHRRRLFLLGTRAPLPFTWPAPTHGPGGLLGLQPWVTVRQALGLGPAAFAAGRLPGAKGWHGQRLCDVDQPGYTVGTTTADLLDQPAPCITGTEHKAGSGFGSQGAQTDPRRAGDRIGPALAAAGILDRPSTTADGSGTLSAAYRVRGHERQKNGAVRLNVQQLALLQSFPPDFTFSGNLTSQYRQVGNAVPPLLAEAIGRSIRGAL